MTSLFETSRSDFLGSAWQPMTEGPDASLADYFNAANERYGRAYRATSPEYGLQLELEPIVERAKKAGYEGYNPANHLLGGSDAKGTGEARFKTELERLNKFMVESGIGDPITRDNLESSVKAKAVEAETAYEDISSDWMTTIIAEAGAAIPQFFADLFASGPGGPATAVMGAKWKALGNASQKFLSTGTALSVARVAAIDALIGGGQELYLQAGIKEWRNKVGIKHDYGDMAAAVGLAGVASGVLRGGGTSGVVAGKAGRDALFPERALGREMLEQVGSSPMAVRLEGVRDNLRKKLHTMTHQELRDGFAALEQAGVQIPKVARGALNTLEREANAAEMSPFKVDDPAALSESNERINAEVINILAQGEKRIDLPPTTREVDELDVHYYDNLDQEIYRFNPEEIKVDAKMFQFKEGGDQFGVTERLQGVTDWDPAMSGHVAVYEFSDGRRFIADGHQRLGLAKRIQSQDPNQNIKLYGRLYREADGITPETAMIDAALTNIAQGTGSVVDAAKVLKIDSNILSRRLPPRSPLVRTANDLVRLSDDAFGLVVNEIVPANYAAIVGRLVRDPEKHAAIMRVLKDTDPSNVTQAEAIVRQAMDAEFTVATQDTLFGEEMLVESLFKERAKVLDETIKMLRKDRAVFNSLVENQQRIEASGNKLETTQNVEKAKTDGEAIQILQVQANRKGPLSDALTEAAKAFKESGRAAPSARAFADDVRGAIERGDLDSIPERGDVVDVDATPQINTIAASHVERLDDFAEPGGKGYENQADLLEREVVEVAELDGADDLLDMMVPTGRMLEDANAKPLPEMRSVEDMFREIEQDKSMLDRLKDCV